jgi:cytoskeletal protein CcmA (bactofilin family)
MRVFALTLALLAVVLVGSASAAPLQGEADDDAVVVINGDVTVGIDEESHGVFIVDGNARVAGIVDGDVVLVAGDVLVSGRITGNLVTIAGRATLLPKARVGGDLIYGDEAPRIAPTARVAGEIEKEDWSDALDLLPFIGALIFWLAITVSSLVLGILLLLIAPRAADSVFERARDRIGPVIAIGLAIFIALPLAATLAAVTLVGLPLAIGLGLALLPLAAVAYVTAAWALGRAIVKPPRGRIPAFLAGLAILRLVALVPVLGVVVWIAAVVFGLGLIGAAIGAARKAEAPAGAAAA